MNINQTITEVIEARYEAEQRGDTETAQTLNEVRRLLQNLNGGWR